MSDRDTCQGTKENGEPCPSPFVNENGYCDAHDPDTPEDEMAERGRRGAEVSNARRRHQDQLLPDELPELRSHDDAKIWLEVLGRAVATGRIERDEADPAIRAVREWVQAHEGGLVGEKLEVLQEKVEELEAKRAASPLGSRAG